MLDKDEVTVEIKPTEKVEIDSSTTSVKHECGDDCKCGEDKCGDDCKCGNHENHQEEGQEPPPLTRREAKYLKRSNYEKIANKFNKSFVLGNKKTGQIVEIRAASAFHACNIIGWKKNRVVLLDEKLIVPDAVAETTSTSNI